MLQTPVIAFRKGNKIVRWAYSITESQPQPGESPDYKKGLGSWDKEDLQYIISKDGIDKMIVDLNFDSQESQTAIEEWLGDDSEPRKKHILKTDFSIANA